MAQLPQAEHRLNAQSPTDHAAILQIYSVHPTCHRSNLNLQVVGPVVSAGARHGKVRRDGYRKN